MSGDVSKRKAQRGATVAAMLCLLSQPLAAQTAADREKILLDALNAAEQEDLAGAIDMLGELLDDDPPFNTARVLHERLLDSRAAERSGIGVVAEINDADVRAELLARRAGAQIDSSNRMPDVLLQLSESHAHAVVVDLSLSRLYLYARNANRLELVQHFYASTGKGGAGKQREGDQRTPVGVYIVTRQVEDEILPAFYGVGALPVDYPNEWDRRLQRTGYGIWLHGSPKDTYSRAPRSSDGCVVLSNDVIRDLLPRMQPEKTPVIFAESVNWVSPDELARRRDELNDALLSWRRDWQNLTFQRYSRHYADSFSDGRIERDEWLRRKSAVNDGKSYVNVELDDVSMFAYPGETDLVVVTFRQIYQSNNHDWQGRKRQYWRRIDDVWQIVYEGTVRKLSIHDRGIPRVEASRRVANHPAES